MLTNQIVPMVVIQKNNYGKKMTIHTTQSIHDLNIEKWYPIRSQPIPFPGTKQT